MAGVEGESGGVRKREWRGNGRGHGSRDGWNDGLLEGAGASCQNQDLRDSPKRAYSNRKRLLVHVRLGGIFGYGEKRKPGESAIL